MIIKEVKLKPTQTDIFPTDNPGGLKYAAVFGEVTVVALFDSEYWAKKFCDAANISFVIREVAE